MAYARPLSSYALSPLRRVFRRRVAAKCLCPQRLMRLPRACMLAYVECRARCMLPCREVCHVEPPVAIRRVCLRAAQVRLFDVCGRQ